MTGYSSNTVIFRTTRDVITTNGWTGLWRGTTASLVRYTIAPNCSLTRPFTVFCRNVPGVALYLTSLTQLRTLMATSPYFAPVTQQSNRGLNSSVLPKLTSGGNLLAGASARVAVGFLLNPFTLLKARFEVGLVLLFRPSKILTLANHV